MSSIHISDEAQNDLKEIKAYISEKLGNSTAARSVLRRITEDIRALKEYALLGAPLSSVADLKSDYRFLVTGNYLTFYRVLGREIYIDRVLYGQRDYLHILLEDKAAKM